MSLDVFEKAINEISDKDWSWFPFLWLRPAQHEKITLARVVSIAVLYGLPMSGVMCLALRHLAPATAQQLFAAAVTFPLMFLFLGSVVVGPMWNRRAVREAARSRFRRAAESETEIEPAE